MRPRPCLARGRRAAGLLLLLSVLAGTPLQAQVPVGRVSALQGLATAQQPGGEPRFLVQGDAVREGDTLSTTGRGYAVVTLRDGTRFTLRPATAFTLERFVHGEREQDAGEERAWFRLWRGGVRAVTGVVGQRHPEAFELRTPAATIGVRGTRFDARLCAEDCRAESAEPGGGAPSVALPVVARVVRLEGHATAFTHDRVSRALAPGGALFEAEEVRTGADSRLVLAFRDQSVVSVSPGTVLRISAFSWEQPQRSSHFALDLLRGGLRALTGAIARHSPESVKIRTVTSVIGVRGTGMDIWCEGPCADPGLHEAGGSARCQLAGGSAGAEPDVEARCDQGLFMRTWQGTPYFERGPLEVPVDRVGHIGPDGIPRVLRSVPDFMQDFPAPRPDLVPVDWGGSFGAVDPAGGDGLYVHVREGQVVLQSDAATLHVGPGETGWSPAPGQAARVVPAPRALLADSVPAPESIATGGPLPAPPLLTLGPPGEAICRM